MLPTELLGRAERLQPIAGEFIEEAGEIWFVPRFRLRPGLRYSLLSDGVESASVEVPLAQAPAMTHVVSIHPTAEQVPFNLLRVYVSFSGPMSEGWANRAVRVRRADTGQELPDVFLPMEPELWDASRQRLTLLLDPGRIKRGVGPNRAAGYPLDPGVPINVVVDQTMRDARGLELSAAVERRYEVGAALRERVDVHKWRLSVPRAGSRGHLLVALDRPLDHSLACRFVTVLDPSWSPVGGEARLEDGGSAWRFTPLARWRSGGHRLRVDPRLEDIAGNSVRRIFDRDLDRPDNDPLVTNQVDVPFSIS